MFYHMEGKIHIQEAYPCGLTPVHGLNPGVVHLQEGRGGVVVGPEAVVVGMKEFVALKVVEHLDKY